MKRGFLTLGYALALMGGAQLRAEENIVVYLVQPDELEGPKADLEPIDIEQPQPETPNTPPSEDTRTAAERLDDLIRDIQNSSPRSEGRYQRLEEIVRLEQKDFVQLLEAFLEAPFNPEDPRAEMSFLQIVEKIVTLTFDAPTERDYMERLDRINWASIEHLDQPERFAVLDEELYKKSVAIEARQRNIQRWIMGITTVAGLGIGGVLSYQASKKILPLVANEGGLSSLAKYSGRITITIIGAGVGASAGAYLGFLGSDLLMQYSRVPLDPIDGNVRSLEYLDFLDASYSEMK